MPDENNQGEQNIQQLQKDLDVATHNWKRALADFENYKRRKEAENKELLEFAKEVTVAKLLPTIDALEQALKHLPQYNNLSLNPSPQKERETPLGTAEQGQAIGPSLLMRGEDGREVADDFAKKYQNWQTGINGIVLQLDKVLAELGVQKIEAVGKKFDPNLHEAVREVESETDDGMVVEELQSGFELNGKVIRPSQVVISKKK